MSKNDEADKLPVPIMGIPPPGLPNRPPPPPPVGHISGSSYSHTFTTSGSNASHKSKRHVNKPPLKHSDEIFILYTYNKMFFYIENSESKVCIKYKNDHVGQNQSIVKRIFRKLHSHIGKIHEIIIDVGELGGFFTVFNLEFYEEPSLLKYKHISYDLLFANLEYKSKNSFERDTYHVLKTLFHNSTYLKGLNIRINVKEIMIGHALSAYLNKIKTYWHKPYYLMTELFSADEDSNLEQNSQFV